MRHYAALILKLNSIQAFSTHNTREAAEEAIAEYQKRHNQAPLPPATYGIVLAIPSEHATNLDLEALDYPNLL